MVGRPRGITGKRGVAVALMLLGCSQASWGNPTSCANLIQVQGLQQSHAYAAMLSAEFKSAFLNMTLDKATETISTVGATLLGSALANEIAATNEGIQHMVTLRDEVPMPTRELVTDRLVHLMQASAVRMHKVADTYSKVVRMANLSNVQELSNRGYAFAKMLGDQWACR